MLWYGDRFIIILLSWLGVVHQSPSLDRHRCQLRVICIDMLAEPARCDTYSKKQRKGSNDVRKSNQCAGYYKLRLTSQNI